MKIKKILFSQPEPTNVEKSPYAELIKKYGVQVDFFKFFSIEGIPLAEFKKSHINIADYSSVIITSKNAVDYFFQMVNETKVKLPISTKYFCSNQATAQYLQKYITYRKRRIFYSKNGTPEQLVAEIEQHSSEDNIIVPCAMDTSLNQLLSLLDAKPNIKYTKAEMFKITFPDLKEHINIYDYDMIVLFSPYGIQSLYQSYPDFQQGEMLIAALGTRVVKAAQEMGLEVKLWAPQPEIPSIFMALDKYLYTTNRKR